ncbi:MAG: LuxR family transcriptional regulator, partial [Chloroflexi bacterium]|nr:LuxR family transcriptional regulator [Chloroflexota bacterium]
LDHFRDGVFFVPLAPLENPDDIPFAVLEALPGQFQPGGCDADTKLLDYLREKHVLLVLDNFEHLLDGVDLVAAMLDAAPDVMILVTSRAALNLQAEWVRTITGVSYPDNGVLDGLEDYYAVQLFTERAHRVRGDFAVDADPASVARICRLTEGMPLALELAAGWLNTLTPADIVAEIERDIDILATRSRDVSARHRSIRAVFNHSWRLLTDEDRAVFQKLAVFKGGFTREAAMEVAGAGLPVLAELVDKSLLYLSTEGRYTIHELLRQFAAEHLKAAGEWDATFDRYIAYYLSLLARLLPDIKPIDAPARQIEALDEIEADFENIRTAWTWAIKRGHYHLIGPALETLNFFTDMRGRYQEGLQLFYFAKERLYAETSTEHELLRSQVRSRFYRLTMMSGIDPGMDVQAGIAASLEIARQIEDRHETGYCLYLTAMWLIMQVKTVAHLERGRQGVPPLEEALEHFRAVGDTFYETEVLTWLGNWTMWGEQHEEGQAILKQCLAIKEDLHEINGLAWVTHNLGVNMYQLHRYEEAEVHLQRALALMNELGSIKGIALSDFELGCLMGEAGRLDEAHQHAERALQVSQDYHFDEGIKVAYALRSLLASIRHEDYTTARAYAEESLVISRRDLFSYSDRMVYFTIAIAACGQGDFETVRQNQPYFFWRELNNPSAATFYLATEAVILSQDGESETAVELLGLAFNQVPSASGWMEHWPLLTRLRAQLIAELGTDAYAAAWERGAAQDLESTIRRVMGQGAEAIQLAANQALAEPLTERELEVLHLLAEGLSNREIAERLVLSLGTVKVHTRNIYGKLDVGSRTQAIARGADLQLL